MTNVENSANLAECYTRRYRLSDIDAIAAIAMQEVPLLPNYRTVKVDPSRVRFILENNLNNEGTFMTRVLCDSQTDTVRGYIMGYCVSAMFSWDKIVSDVFLVILPEWRTVINAQMLVRVYKKWGLLRKPKIISASHTSGYRPEQMTRFLESEGFQQIGTLFHLTMENEDERTVSPSR